MSYEDAQPFRLFELNYQATNDQANEVWLRLIETRKFIEFETAYNRLYLGQFNASDGAMCSLCEQLAILKRDVTREAAKIISQVCAQEETE